MRKKIVFCIVLTAFISLSISSQTVDEISKNRVKLPNGWSVTPVGKLVPLGDLPLHTALSPSKKLAAVTNNGYGTQLIQLIDIKTGQVLDSSVIRKSWLGLTFSAD